MTVLFLPVFTCNLCATVVHEWVQKQTVFSSIQVLPKEMLSYIKNTQFNTNGISKNVLFLFNITCPKKV